MISAKLYRNLSSKFITKYRREAIHLREHIKRIIRETIINIEAHLFKAGKIKSLLLYDHQSEFMFEAFYNLGEILPECKPIHNLAEK